jgi:hypothetical protein
LDTDFTDRTDFSSAFSVKSVPSVSRITATPNEQKTGSWRASDVKLGQSPDMARKPMWIFLTAFALLTVYNVLILRFNLLPLMNPILSPLTSLHGTVSARSG